MRIRKLEISGFKSFVDRTVIHFDTDVVGIVGPNGCGKSNIVDAIRWTMGEQSAKHLRGRAMSDVIFNGSEHRGPHGMAEVTLTFDNGDPEIAATLPLEYREYAEIAVTRRLFRDGTSEYLINKTQVRLKDVTDLFLGTGVGTKAYSIIEQGKIGLIVSARPEDRRMLIEEAAGITKYKARKKQAELKMDQTRQNLLRVGDIVSEIQRSLASLKRQAAKAERYVSYKNELEDLILHEASHKLLENHRPAQGRGGRARGGGRARAGSEAPPSRRARPSWRWCARPRSPAEDRAEKAQQRRLPRGQRGAHRRGGDGPLPRPLPATWRSAAPPPPSSRATSSAASATWCARRASWRSSSSPSTRKRRPRPSAPSRSTSASKSCATASARRAGGERAAQAPLARAGRRRGRRGHAVGLRAAARRAVGRGGRSSRTSWAASASRGRTWIGVAPS